MVESSREITGVAREGRLARPLSRSICAVSPGTAPRRTREHRRTVNNSTQFTVPRSRRGSLVGMGSCSTSTDVAVWKPPLFSFAPTPPVDRKFIAAARRLDRIRTESNGTLVWWQSASAAHEIARQLDEQSFAVIDKFGGPNEALETRNAAIQSLKYQHA